MAQYTNQSNLPISIAVFLAFRDYDSDPRPNSISVTTLLKSVRQISSDQLGHAFIGLIKLIRELGVKVRSLTVKGAR